MIIVMISIIIMIIMNVIIGGGWKRMSIPEQVGNHSRKTDHFNKLLVVDLAIAIDIRLADP